jgi:hypothetical protein
MQIFQACQPWINKNQTRVTKAKQTLVSLILDFNSQYHKFYDIQHSSKNKIFVKSNRTTTISTNRVYWGWTTITYLINQYRRNKALDKYLGASISTRLGFTNSLCCRRWKIRLGNLIPTHNQNLTPLQWTKSLQIKL